MDDSGLPMKCGVTQTETKPDQSNALYPNELGLGRIRVMQERIRPLCNLCAVLCITTEEDHRSVVETFGCKQVYSAGVKHKESIMSTVPSHTGLYSINTLLFRSSLLSGCINPLRTIL